jgi:predicted acyltransferase
MIGMSATLTLTASPQEKTVTAPRRVLSIDLLRGLTIALMILVNDPGDWDHVFRPLDHAEWNGWTLTDMVFPTFLFVVGVSMVFSIAARRARGNCRGSLIAHVFARTGKLLLLAFVLDYFPRMHWTTLRFFGVIPRIAICSLLAGLVLLATMTLRRQAWAVAAVVVALLVGYWVLLRWVPVPGLGMPGRDFPFMDESRNLASWIDRGAVAWTQHWLHTGSLYRKVRDPEGVLSTLPAVATTLLGALTGMWLRATRSESMEISPIKANVILAAAGVAAVLAGELWSVWFPINKNLWTSSYVLLMAGWAVIALALLSLLVDERPKPWPRWLNMATWPWFVFGSNAIAAYTTSAVLVKSALYFHVGKMTVWGWVYEHGFAFNGSTYWSSLAFAVMFVVVCFLPNWWLWCKKWFWKM